MRPEPDIDTEALVDEIVRYLIVVEVFRDESCEPTWRPETAFRLDESTPSAPRPLEASAH
jgi:hypothetical protein